MTQHLSAERVTAWMMGEQTRGETEHLRECVDCRMEVERLRSSLELFRGSVRGWSEEQRAVTVPQVCSVGKSHGWRWATAAAAIALVMGAIPVYQQQKRAEMARQDAMLLEQVDAELSESVARPMQPLSKLVWRTNSWRTNQ
jgi:hypothetical protein